MVVTIKTVTPPPSPVDPTVNIEALMGTVKESCMGYVDSVLSSQQAANREYVDKATALLHSEIIRLSSNTKAIMHVQLDDLPIANLEKSAHPQLADTLQYMRGLKQIDPGMGVWLHGPAGTGKSEIFLQAAQTLALPYYNLSCTGETTKGELIGRYSHANGKWEYPLFVEAFRNGGVFSFEEIDQLASDVAGVILTAMSQRILFLGDGSKVAMHPDCYIVATGNTAGTGATANFTGRTRQDGALVDRFLRLFVGYNEVVDKACCPHEGLRTYLTGIRSKLQELRARDETLTARSMRRAYLHMTLGLPANKCVDLLTPGWSEQVVKQSGLTAAGIQTAWEVR